jgi:hypothetical protein
LFTPSSRTNRHRRRTAMRSLRRRALAMGACAAMIHARRRYRELHHCAHPGWLEQRDRAGQTGPATRPARLHTGCRRLRSAESTIWPSGEFVVQHHAVGQRWHHHADRNRSRRDPIPLQASLLNSLRRVNSGTHRESRLTIHVATQTSLEMLVGRVGHPAGTTNSAGTGCALKECGKPTTGLRGVLPQVQG